MSTDKLEAAFSFLLASPPGEVNDVFNDIRVLVNDDDMLTKGITPALEQYNKSQFITVKLPGSEEEVIISDSNYLADEERFVDSKSQRSFSFDHLKLKARDVQDYEIPEEHCEFTKRLLEAAEGYVSEHYPSQPAYAVHPPTRAGDKYTLLIVGNKYSPSNFWNGRWRSRYLVSVESGAIQGTMQVDVHYYEDGNVQLASCKEVMLEAGAGEGEGEAAARAEAVVKAVCKAERAYQAALNGAFGGLSEGAFKGLRRQLPVTRQKIEWDKVGSGLGKALREGI